MAFLAYSLHIGFTAQSFDDTLRGRENSGSWLLELSDTWVRVLFAPTKVFQTDMEVTDCDLLVYPQK